VQGVEVGAARESAVPGFELALLSDAAFGCLTNRTWQIYVVNLNVHKKYC